MTRKDYRRVAESLRQARMRALRYTECGVILDQLENFWIDILARDNPRFDTAKFKEASHGNE